MGTFAVEAHYSPDAKRLFTGSASGRLTVWDTSVIPIQSLSTFPNKGERALPSICAIDYHHPTHTAFVGSREGLTLWNVRCSTGTNKCRGCLVGEIRVSPLVLTTL